MQLQRVNIVYDVILYSWYAELEDMVAIIYLLSIKQTVVVKLRAHIANSYEMFLEKYWKKFYT